MTRALLCGCVIPAVSFCCECDVLLFSWCRAPRSATYVCNEQLSYVSVSWRLRGSFCGEASGDDPDFSYCPWRGMPFFWSCSLTWSFVLPMIFPGFPFPFVPLIGSQMLVLGCSRFPFEWFPRSGSSELPEMSPLSRFDLILSGHCILGSFLISMRIFPWGIFRGINCNLWLFTRGFVLHRGAWLELFLFSF